MAGLAVPAEAYRFSHFRYCTTGPVQFTLCQVVAALPHCKQVFNVRGALKKNIIDNSTLCHDVLGPLLSHAKPPCTEHLQPLSPGGHKIFFAAWHSSFIATN